MLLSHTRVRNPRKTPEISGGVRECPGFSILIHDFPRKYPVNSSGVIRGTSCWDNFSKSFLTTSKAFRKKSGVFRGINVADIPMDIRYELRVDHDIISSHLSSHRGLWKSRSHLRRKKLKHFRKTYFWLACPRTYSNMLSSHASQPRLQHRFVSSWWYEDGRDVISSLAVLVSRRDKTALESRFLFSGSLKIKFRFGNKSTVYGWSNIF